MSNSGKSDSAKVALAYIESLTARFVYAERHINDDIEAIEKRLTQLVELMKTVSTMQQQVTNQQQILAELRSAVREGLVQHEELVEGIDTRYSGHFETIKRKVSEVAADQTAGRKKLDGRVSQLEEKLQTWLNRGIGMWAVFALVVGFFQYVGMQYIGNLQRERAEAHATIQRLSTRISDLEMRQQSLEDLRQRGIGGR